MRLPPRSRGRSRLSLLALGAALALPLPAAAAPQAPWRPPADPAAAEPRWRLTLEAGPLFTSRNDVRIPGNTGTDLAFERLTGDGPFAAARASLDWRWRPRHALRLTAAPLTLSGTGLLERPTEFAGATFAAGVPTKGTYRFDTYRLGYRYRLLERGRLSLHVGATLLVRSAEIALTQGSLSARKTDLGLVPLLHADLEWRFAPGWRALLDVDGAAAPQGRAFDVSLGVRRRLSRGLELGLGYRGIEGGADNDEVFTFAWTHAAVLSLTIGL